ncbi:MAG TPA: AI-2E family transporter [Chloroflexota bacterium]|nr:AI-2E family transporter [Chloroflexota bacterium]
MSGTRGEDTRRPIQIVIEPRSIWTAAGIVIGLLLLWIVVTRGLTVLILLFIGIIVAEGLRPLVAWLAAHHIPRPIAVLVIVAVTLALLAFLLWLLLAPLVSQATQLAVHLPQYLTRLQTELDHLARGFASHSQIQAVSKQARSRALGALNGLVGVAIHTPLYLVGLLFEGLTLLFIVFFWLTAIDGLRDFALGLVAGHHRDTAAAILDELQESLGGYARGVGVNMLIAGVVAGGGLELLGVPYAVLLGVVAGLVQMIPIVGTYISAAAGIGVALLSLGPLKAAEVWIFFVVVQEVQGGVILPLVMNRIISLNPLTVLVATLLGGAILGVAGAVIAVPVAVIVRILLLSLGVPALQGTPPRPPRLGSESSSAAEHKGAENDQTQE